MELLPTYFSFYIWDKTQNDLLFLLLLPTPQWRGRWQVGIRCSRADWPLSTVKGKPTHDRKKYFVIFFPHTRNYSWADTLLVRPISDYPHPIAYRTHKSGLKLVRDLSVARRFIMRKLAMGMLNIIDQFHMEVTVMVVVLFCSFLRY